jgi:hypothetical protein
LLSRKGYLAWKQSPAKITSKKPRTIAIVERLPTITSRTNSKPSSTMRRESRAPFTESEIWGVSSGYGTTPGVFFPKIGNTVAAHRTVSEISLKAEGSMCRPKQIKKQTLIAWCSTTVIQKPGFRKIDVEPSL